MALAATIQGSQYGVLIDRGEVDVVGCYFENTVHAVTIQGSARSRVTNNIFRNCIADQGSTEPGYAVMNRVASVLHGGNSPAAIDRLYVNEYPLQSGDVGPDFN